MNKKILSMMALTGVVSISIYNFAYADNYAFRYLAPGVKTSSSLGSGSVPEDDLGEELSGAQRVVEFSIDPSTIRVPQDFEDNGVNNIVFSGRVANNNNKYDGSVEEVFIGLSHESSHESPWPIPVDKESGEFGFELEIVDEEVGIIALPFPASDSARYLAVVNDEDSGKEASLSIEEGGTIEIVDFLLEEDPYLNGFPYEKGEFNLALVAFFDVSYGRMITPDVVKVHWSSTIGVLENSVTYIENHYGDNVSINYISSDAVGKGDITFRIEGWGNAEDTIPIEFESPSDLCDLSPQECVVVPN